MWQLLKAVPDNMLATLFRGGDERAFAVLFDRHYKFAFGIAYRRLHSVDAAHDACQEAFSRVAEYIDSFDDLRPFRPWLGTIVYREATKLSERMKIDERLEPLDMYPDTNSTSDSYNLPMDGDIRLRQALNELTPTRRAILELRYYDGHSMKDIGSILGKKPNAVSVSHHHAIDQLREALSNVE